MDHETRNLANKPSCEHLFSGVVDFLVDISLSNLSREAIASAFLVVGRIPSWLRWVSKFCEATSAIRMPLAMC